MPYMTNMELNLNTELIFVGAIGGAAEQSTAGGT
jgi:hypothetical protein